MMRRRVVQRRQTVGRRRSVSRGVGAVIATLVLALAPAAAASAHDYLVASSPAAGTTVHVSPSTITLTFDDVVLYYGRGSTALLVTGPGSAKRQYETSCAAVSNRNVSAKVALGAAGTYTVTWRVVSADGHPVTNSIQFTYAPPAGAARSAGTPTGPDCGVSKASFADAAKAGPPGVSGVVWVVVGVVGGLIVLAFIVIAVLALLRATRPAPIEPTEHE